MPACESSSVSSPLKRRTAPSPDAVKMAPPSTVRRRACASSGERSAVAGAAPKPSGPAAKRWIAAAGASSA